MATLFTVIFADGTTDGFDSVTGTGLAVIAPGLVANNYCLAVTNADTNARYGQIAAAGDESQVRAFFSLDPFTIDPLVMANNDAFTVLLCQDNAANDTFRVELGYAAATGFRVRPSVYTDGAAWSNGTWVDISTNEHMIEVEWNAATGVGQDDGMIEMWVDVYGDHLGDPFGAADSSVTGVDDDTRAARVFRLGAPAGLDAGTSGTFWVDHLVVNDDGTEIGHPGTLAFPRAQGAGRFSVGGRGGTVYIVSNTDNAGAGSFRAACEASGARIIVFTTDGIIQLTSNINVNNPYISIFGQTAPGDGICLRDYTLRVRTHDVIIQHIRSRPGDTSEATPEDLDAIDFANNPSSNTDADSMVFNIIIDHCSVSWAIDGNLDVYNSAPEYSWIKNVTVQWCIISHGLSEAGHAGGEHSMGLLFGTDGDLGNKNISVHHNLMAHNRRRNPRMSETTCFEVVNNVMHDCPGYVLDAEDSDSSFNFIENDIGSQSNNGTVLIEPDVATADPADYFDHQIYVIGEDGNYWVDDDWQLVYKGWGNGHPASGAFQTAWESSTAIYISNSQLPYEARETAREKVLRCAGCFPRDSYDDAVVDNVRNNTTDIIDSQTEVGSWPTLTGGTPGADTDSDGMPDTWEDAHGTDDEVADDDGYDVDPMNWWTNIEIYAFTSAERCRKRIMTGIMGG